MAASSDPASTPSDGYSPTQIMLHWSVAILVAFQFFLNDGIAAAWRAMVRGEEPAAEAASAADVHVTIGLTILALALWRIVLRLTFGAPGGADPVIEEELEGDEDRDAPVKHDLRRGIPLRQAAGRVAAGCHRPLLVRATITLMLVARKAAR